MKGALKSRLSPANLLSGFRLCAAPAMIGLALAGSETLFLCVLAASFFSDAIDGTVARLTGGTSRFGAMLDSWADVAAYTAIAISVAVLWPELVRREWLAVSVIVASFVLPSLVGHYRFGRFTSYHTLLVKLAVGATAAGLFVLLLGGPAWPFRMAAVLAALAALEEIAISLVLVEPRSNVGGLPAVWRAERDERRGQSGQSTARRE